MIVKRFTEAVEKYESTYKPSEAMEGVIEMYSKLVTEGYTKPRGYTLQDIEDKHREKAEYKVTLKRA